MKFGLTKVIIEPVFLCGIFACFSKNKSAGEKIRKVSDYQVKQKLSHTVVI